LPVTLVRATRGKRVRAEPIAALYEQGRVHHVGAFQALEDQMCAFTPDAILAKSPDRVDALVWALTELSGRGGAVFSFSAARNGAAGAPAKGDVPSAVLGVRLGIEGDALAVLRWGRHSPVVHLVEEWTGPRESAAALAGRLRETIAKHGTRVIVVDPGEAGRALVDELRARHRLPLVVAEPGERLAAIELLNDTMRAGNFLAPPDGLFARDSRALEWDRSRAKPEIVGSSAIVDAVIAAFPRVAAWAVKPRPATAEEERARFADALVKARTPPTPEELNASARAEMGEYDRELQRERRRAERDSRFLWRW
jgi:hypothetical protein